MTALGPNSYFWLENRAMICISIHTPCVRKLHCKQETEWGGVCLKTHEIWQQTILPWFHQSANEL